MPINEYTNDNFSADFAHLSDEEIRYERMCAKFSAEINTIKALNAKLLAALEKVTPPEIEDADWWWCPTCKDHIGGANVTFEENCDRCGTYLSDCQAEDAWAECRDAIANAKGES